ncbi:MAG: dephospho-CoA kinase [Acidobacteria bacterium OLB17]|nr:MAG: dephospho-CoA kinase [Acidobacteria bacterium OLB17]MCZ2390973.1 dephospho-CoA kinase [Acidobacteriota bacterium]
MIKVGLTGSIATGKSFVTECLRELGADVIDADQAARKVVEKGTPGLAAIVEEFGEDVLTSAGELDRKKLGAIVFADEARRKRLNAIVHPLVIELQDEWLKGVRERNENAIAVVDAALMIESGGYERFDKLIVVYCEPAIQLARLMARDNLSETEARRRIDAQMPQDEKRKFADHVIDTSKGYEDTRRQAEEIYALLAEAAGNDEAGMDTEAL